MDDVEGLRLPHSVLPRNYHIELTPRPSSRPELGFETFEATVSITVDVVDTVREFRLNASGLRLHRCTFDGMDGQILVNEALQQLTIKWPRDIRAGSSGVLSIHYDGDVREGSTGLYQNSYQNGKRRGIGTQMEMAEARRFLPCWDEPAFKATFELAIIVPSFYVVLFNSALSGTPTTAQQGLTRHVFGRTPKMSSYLLAIFVGEAESISAKTARGVELRVWTPVGHRELGKLAVGGVHTSTEVV
jgi:puromycin-sensitive aminopeptidase